MEEQTVSITLWGDGLAKKKWLDWYHDMNYIFQQLGYESTHIGILSKTYKSKKILSVVRKEKEILKKLYDGEEPLSLSLYSLPNEYKTAAFDYNVLIVRQDKYISLVFNMSDFEKIDSDDLVVILLKYIEFESGEIYVMNRNEMPLIYASKANSIDMFKSLKILKKINRV